MKKQKRKKSIISKFKNLFVALTILGTLAWIGLFALNYIIGDEVTVDLNGVKITSKKKEEINALICGTNQELSDSMIYVKYNVKTGKVAMMAIPRDTYVDNEYGVGHKLNAIYRGKNAIPLVEQIEDLLSVNIDYYLFYDSKMLIDMVDAIGGVEVDVPIRMKYDDPTQNLHIDLKKGVQVLNGAQAEQFVRFRKNNDGTGYVMGDLDRTKAQQEFIKSFINTILMPKNLTKITTLVNIALDNTDTNVTAREALKYVTDIGKLDTSSLKTFTAPGTAEYIDGLSYFMLDKNETSALIEKEFNLKDTVGKDNVGTENNSQD